MLDILLPCLVLQISVATTSNNIYQQTVTADDGRQALEPPAYFRFHVKETDQENQNQHFRFGVLLASQFRDKMVARVRDFAAHYKFEARYFSRNKTLAEGILAELATFHEQQFPDYFAELKGFAEGSGLSMQDILLTNFEQEFRGIFDQRYSGQKYYVGEETRYQNSPMTKSEDHCSDYGACDSTEKSFCANGHNEDNKAHSANRTVLVDVKFAGQPQFVALAYLGDLPSTAFGLNTNKVGVTMNWLGAGCKAYTWDFNTGKANFYANTFVSRALLDSGGFEDAIDLLQRRLPHIAGQNFQLLDFKDKHIVRLETGPDGRSSLQPFYIMAPSSKRFWHTNHYIALQEPHQDVQVNSVRRYNRFIELDGNFSAIAERQQNLTRQILVALGDQVDTEYPIFHDQTSRLLEHAGNSWTLTSAYFDLLANNMKIFWGNPEWERVFYEVGYVGMELVVHHFYDGELVPKEEAEVLLV